MKLFLWRVYFHFKYHSLAFVVAVQNEWRLYRETRKIPGLNVEIRKDLLEMATEKNGVNKYPTPNDMQDFDVVGYWTEKQKNYPKEH